MTRYISTRGKAPTLTFEEAVLTGLATDGGLYVPEYAQEFSMAEIDAMQGMSYPELAYTVISRFTGTSIKPEVLERIVADSYKSFRHAAIAPLKQLDTHTFVLELFHGPTLAFKDFALQFVGRLLDHILESRNQKSVVVGATSGDTGSAAIAGCQGRKNMDIFILHPKGRVSEVQRRQMTSVMDDNVHNLAIEGTFDDCQDIIKALFADGEFRERHRLSAVNSINWARILAQVVYYFYSAVALGAPAKNVSFAVPTGNFGDIYAGHIARRMGLNIEQLVIATNKNDILARCLQTGVYGMEDVHPTLSPSMDIQVSSNFERLLFDLYDCNGETITDMMDKFRKEKKITLSTLAWNRLKAEFNAHAVSDEETKRTIAVTFNTTGELLDPHTAVGLAAARAVRKNTSTPMIVLATAHPAKFPDAVKEASGVKPELPPHLQDLYKRRERCETLANDVE
ncbi:MAG: threonine synthase, partial [Rickettsiales bacterium]|nr:threonine synthase [Rickettsiales bacterium]